MQSVKFGNGQLRRLKRHRAEPYKAVGVAATDLGDKIIDRARSRKPELGIGAIISLAGGGGNRLDVDPHPVHVFDALFGRYALLISAFAIGPIDCAALWAGLGLEKPTRNVDIAFDELRRLFAPDMAVDIDREPFAAGMHRAGETPRDRRAFREAFEQHLFPHC